jgi:hypothetical protein
MVTLLAQKVFNFQASSQQISISLCFTQFNKDYCLLIEPHFFYKYRDAILSDNYS